MHNTDGYWIKKLADSKPTMTHGALRKTKINENKKNSYECITFGESKQHGFFRGPMFDPDGRLIIAYDIIEHADSLVYNNTLIFNKNIYDYKPGSVSHIYFIPANAIPKEAFQITFGYLLKQDSVDKCYNIRCQTIRINPGPKAM